MIPGILRPARRRFSRLLAVTLVVTFAAMPPADARSVPAPPSPSTHTPVYAYFYQWYEHGSWNRAKKDFPLAGKYSSDDPHVLRSQVRQAQAAGIDGFLTSWKSTPTLDRRLTLLLDVAHDQHFDIGVVYEALDFARHPLPIQTVQTDLVHLITQWGSRLRSSSYGRPVIIWTGTDQYSVTDVQAVRKALGDRAYLLAASTSVPGYQRVSATVDGEAYYWSSANPRLASTQRKMNEMGAAVHQHRGIWIAPAATGFDATTLGHTRLIDRDAGRTLVRSLTNAFGSKPDGVGLISWNEWSENTYIEPSERYGSQDLTTLRDYLRQRRGRPASPAGATAPSASHGGWSGLRAVVLLTVITGVGLVLLSLRIGRRPRHRVTRRRPARSGRQDRARRRRGSTTSDDGHKSSPARLPVESMIEPSVRG